MIRPVRVPSYIKGSAGSTEYQVFPSKYFSGCDVNIYLGGIWVDEVSAIEFSVQENVQPIYGYASYTADAWARGTRIITGNLNIHFRESYYLHSIINEIEYRKRPGTDYGGDSRRPPPARTIEEILASTTGDTSDERFQNLAKEYQKAIWGDTADEAFAERVEQQEYDAYFYPKKRRPFVHEHGLDILITYGPFHEAYKIAHSSSRFEDRVNYTVESITGVQIASKAKIINSHNGEPIQEQYHFRAKDINYKIT